MEINWVCQIVPTALNTIQVRKRAEIKTIPFFIIERLLVQLDEAFDFSLPNALSIEAFYWKASHGGKVWFGYCQGAHTHSHSDSLVQHISISPADSLTCPSGAIPCLKIEGHVSPDRGVPNERIIIFQPILCCCPWTLWEVLQTRGLSLWECFCLFSA